MRLHTQILRTALFLGGLATFGSVASAHSFPQSESPSAGQELSESPSAVTITYDAPIEKLFAQLDILKADGKSVVNGTPVVGDDGRTLSIKVDTLKPGDYTVKWSVICIDTHHTEGSYQFTVKGGDS